MDCVPNEAVITGKLNYPYFPEGSDLVYLLLVYYYYKRVIFYLFFA